MFATEIRRAYLEWCRQHNVEPLECSGEVSGDDVRCCVTDVLDKGADAIYSIMPPQPAVEQIQLELAQRNLKWGKDVRVVVLDEDHDFTMANLGVSTARFNAAAYARECISRLIDAIEERQTTQSRLPSKYEVVERGSSS